MFLLMFFSSTKMFCELKKTFIKSNKNWPDTFTKKIQQVKKLQTITLRSVCVLLVSFYQIALNYGLDQKFLVLLGIFLCLISP